MTDIRIQKEVGDQYKVTVNAARTTTHRVTCSRAMIERFAPGADPEVLLRASFEFLLERESNARIQATFDLPVIERYFPEFASHIRTRLLG